MVEFFPVVSEVCHGSEWSWETEVGTGGGRVVIEADLLGLAGIGAA